MSNIRIALCITELNIGGAEKCLTEIARRVDRQRFTPVVYCLGPKPAHPETSYLPALEESNVEVHFLGGEKIWQFPIIASRLKRHLLTQKPHIAHSFLFHANIATRVAARRAGVPSIISGIRVAERHSRWHLWLDRRTQNLVDRYVCVSQSVADFSTHEAGIPPAKIVVIPNGVDLQKYPASKPADPTSLGLSTERKIIASIGRLEPQKGISWLIETSPRWLKNNPNHDLLIVGDGPLKNQLESTCRNLRIADRVHFTGWRADVPEILAASDLLVLPSRWEGMPNVVLEAMASRLPVVATDVEGVRELFGKPDPRQMTPFGDTELLCQKITAFLSDPTWATSVGNENRLRVENDFSIARMVANYETLWDLLAVHY
jgi:starch synthase (maltosyl-transferring)